MRQKLSRKLQSILSCIFWALHVTLADSGCLRGRGENSKKGTCCMQWGTSVQKVVRHITASCPLEGRLRGHFTTFFLHIKGTLDGTLPCFIYHRGIRAPGGAISSPAPSLSPPVSCEIETLRRKANNSDMMPLSQTFESAEACRVS